MKDFGKEWLDAWNSHNPANVAAVLADGGLFNDPILKHDADARMSAGYAAALIRAFPDLHFDMVSTTKNAEREVVEWVSRGTNTGPLLSTPPTQARCEFPGVSVIKIRDERIAHVFDYWDAKQLLDQLGLKEFPM